MVGYYRNSEQVMWTIWCWFTVKGLIQNLHREHTCVTAFTITWNHRCILPLWRKNTNSMDYYEINLPDLYNQQDCLSPNRSFCTPLATKQLEFQLNQQPNRMAFHILTHAGSTFHLLSRPVYLIGRIWKKSSLISVVNQPWILQLPIH